MPNGERRVTDDGEILRMRNRLHALEGKMVTVELLVKHLIDRLDSKDRTFKWIVGIAIAAGPLIGTVIEKW